LLDAIARTLALAVLLSFYVDPCTSSVSAAFDQAWAHEIFIFRTEKFEISGHQSHKKCTFVISGAYNFGTFRAEAKITIRRHEVVYRLSSERKIIDLE